MSAEFESATIWEQWSIDAVRLALVTAWLSTFAALGLSMSTIGPGSFRALLSKAPGPYVGEDDYYFMSYAHVDLARVMPFLDALSERGHRVWYDKGIPGGAQWDETLSHRIRGCRGLVAFVTRSSLESKWTQREILFADSLDKPVFAVRIEPCTLRPPLDMILARSQIVEGDADQIVEAFESSLSQRASRLG